MNNNPAENNIHTFDNGIRVQKSHLLKTQLKRYQQQNLHEPEEEKIFLNILNKLSGDELFINVGAAIGYYLILAKKIKPNLPIIGFEPLASHRRFIHENFTINGLDIRQIELDDRVISSHTGEITFREDTFCSHVATDASVWQSLKSTIKRIGRIILGRQKARLSRQLKKPTTTIDQYLQDRDDHVGLIQIDVQGHELDVLKGCEKSLKNRQISYLLIGTHSPKLHTNCKNYLLSYDYQIVLDEYETAKQPDGILLVASGNR